MCVCMCVYVCMCVCVCVCVCLCVYVCGTPQMLIVNLLGGEKKEIDFKSWQKISSCVARVIKF